IDARREGLARRPAAGDVDDERVDRHPRHPLGRVDREADRALRSVEIDDDPGLHAPRALMAEAEHLHVMRPARNGLLPAMARGQLGDDAAELRRADVEDADDRALAGLGPAAAGVIEDTKEFHRVARLAAVTSARTSV